MQVLSTSPVEIALRTLGAEDREEVLAWFENLRNWEKDTVLRSRAQRLSGSDNVYVLKTGGDFRIFFRLESDRLVVLDLATKATIVGSGHMTGTGRS